MVMAIKIKIVSFNLIYITFTPSSPLVTKKRFYGENLLGHSEHHMVIYENKWEWRSMRRLLLHYILTPHNVSLFLVQ